MGFMQMSWQQGVMLLISFFLLYLAIHKKYEPLLLLPIAFGMLLTNLPGAGMFHSELWSAFLKDIGMDFVIDSTLTLYGAGRIAATTRNKENGTC